MIHCVWYVWYRITLITQKPQDIKIFSECIFRTFSLKLFFRSSITFSFSDRFNFCKNIFKIPNFWWLESSIHQKKSYALTKISKLVQIWSPNYKKKVIIVSRERFSHFFEFRGEILVSKLHPPPPAKSPQKLLGGGEWYSSSERAILLVCY